MNVGTGKFAKNNKCRAFNKRRAWKILCELLCLKKSDLTKEIELENIRSPWKKIPKFKKRRAYVYSGL